MSKKPKTTTRKPNAKTRAWYDAHPPVVVPTPHVCSSLASADFEVTTSSRTQAPKKPVKPTRIKKPRPLWGFSVLNENFEEGPCVLKSDWLCLHGPDNIRELAAWLTHAASWIEQEARRGKK
jgi:hypothetical protein